MGTLACTLNGFINFGGAAWSSTLGYYSTSDAIAGLYGYGRTSDSNQYRCIVLKVTMPTISSAYTHRQLKIQIPLYRTPGGGTDYWYYRISTTGPTLTTASPQFPSAANATFAGTFNLYTDASWTMRTITTDPHNFASGQTYYIWLLSETQMIGQFANHTSYGGKISVSLLATTLYKPSSCALSGYSGYYGGASVKISGTSCNYCYVATSTSGPFYCKSLSSMIFTVDADTSSTSKAYYVALSTENLGTLTKISSSYYISYSVPRFACRVYRHSTSATTYSGNSGTFSPTYGSTTLKGLTTSSSSTTVSYTASSNTVSWDTYGAKINGKTLYGIYTESKTVSYYKGGSTKRSYTSTRTLYGTASATSFTYWSDWATCDLDSSYTCTGWTNSASSTSPAYTSLATAIANYSTIYSIYKKAGSSSGSTVYYYRGDATKNSVTKTTTVADAYIYGTGSKTGGGTSYSYGTITTTCALDGSATLKGWSASSGGKTSSYSTPQAAFNAGNTTIYGIYTQTFTVQYYRGTKTAYTANPARTIYGAGSKDSYALTEPERSCLPPWDNYEFAGWGTDADSKAISCTTIAACAEAGYGTVYGVYSLTGTMIYHPENGQESGAVSATNYVYGQGELTNNVPEEPALTKKGYELAGYSYGYIDSDGKLHYGPWESLWNIGYREVWAFWIPLCPVYLGRNGVWLNTMVYYGTGGKWKLATVKYIKSKD